MTDQNKAPHNLSTSSGGRAYLAEYFATQLRRHDFARYIENMLAADFASTLAQHLSELRAPVASAEVMDALNWVDDFIARCNGDDVGACESVNVLRRALASAPVAREATPSRQALLEAIHRYGNARAMAEHNIAYRDEVRNTADALIALFDAAPQASEAVRGALMAFDEAMRLCDDFPELQHHRDALLFAVQKARAALSAQPVAQNPHPKQHNDGDVAYG